MLSTPVDLGPVGAQARDNKSGRLQASSKTENSVVTTGSNRTKIPNGHKCLMDRVVVRDECAKPRVMGSSVGSCEA
jgi:hypothetical protein